MDDRKDSGGGPGRVPGQDAIARAAADGRFAWRWVLLLGSGTLVSSTWVLGFLWDGLRGPPSAGTVAGSLLAAAATGLLLEGFLALGIGIAARIPGNRIAVRGWLAAFAAARLGPMLLALGVLPAFTFAAFRWPGEVRWTGWAGAVAALVLLAGSVAALVRAVRAVRGIGARRALAAVGIGGLALGGLALTGVPLRLLVDPYEFPTGSMTPSVLAGDRALVNRAEYGIPGPVPGGRLAVSLPRRGDMIVFRTPFPDDDPGHEYMKRVIALPGDRIGLFGDRLFLNGEPVPTLLLDDSAWCDDETLVDCRCVRQFESLGDVAFVTQHLRPWQDRPVCANHRDWPSDDPMRRRSRNREEGPPAPSSVGVASAAPGADIGGGDAEPRLQDVEVPEGEIFVMGDNRDNSADSRFLGTIPLGLVVGRVTWTYWPPWRVGQVL